jgi:hypothetical protein
MTNRVVGAELFHVDRQADRRTDRHDEAKSLFAVLRIVLFGRQEPQGQSGRKGPHSHRRSFQSRTARSWPELTVQMVQPVTLAHTHRT